MVTIFSTYRLFLLICTNETYPKNNEGKKVFKYKGPDDEYRSLHEWMIENASNGSLNDGVVPDMNQFKTIVESIEENTKNEENEQKNQNNDSLREYFKDGCNLCAVKFRRVVI